MYRPAGCATSGAPLRQIAAPVRRAFFRAFRTRAKLAAVILRSVLALLAAGCFLSQGGKGTSASPPEGEIALTVTNHNFLDVVIYIRHDGQDTRVGTVTGSSTQLFSLPTRLLGQGREIQLFGHAIGSSVPARTETFVVQPGQYIEWTLETDLRRSSVAVY